ncbi:MAG: zinc-ribbon domain-containing protein [Clostridia bacterium]|nr:zinc-ribbon domain-containing protein [Clostridia bacterium]
MFCSNCGSQVGDLEKFCKNCGTPIMTVQATAPVAQQSAPQPSPVSQPVPQPAVYQQPVQAASQPAYATYQQSVQAVPQSAPALAKTKAGPRKACFVLGLIACISLIVINLPAFAIGGMMLFIGPFAMMLGADVDDIFGIGLLVCFGSFILLDAAIISIVFNSISTKITAKRPASKCRRFRMAAAIIVLVDSLITIAPIIGLFSMLEDAAGFFVFYAIVFILAVVFFVLAIITNSKEKKFASATE